ncbi:MAG TPA: hypothetical protein VFA96_06240, partial [Nocardioides sp.]|nr:hypothetical protein [Nocardioides sp.]
MGALTDPEVTMSAAPAVQAPPAKSRPAIVRWLSPRRIGAIYVWILIIIVFGAIKPSTFLANETIVGIANSYAVAGIAALALLVPLAAGAFDVSIGATMSLVGVVVAKLLLTTSIPMWLIILMGLGVGLAVGLVNSFIVVVLKIPSLIGTLAMLGIADAL